MDETVKEMIQLIFGATRSHLLYCAVKLNIFDHLSAHSMDSAELAKLTNTKKDHLYRFLQSLCSLGVLFENEDHIFSVTELGSVLSSKSKYCLKNYLKMVEDETIQQPLLHLDYSLRTGEAAFDHIFGMTFFEYVRKTSGGNVFDEAMKDIGNICSVLSPYDYSDFKHIIDVGGGNGHFLISILQRNPHCSGTVFDLAATIENAKLEIAKSGVQNRCSTEAGDFMKSVPGGGDCYILRQVIFSFDDQKALALLSNIRKQMKDYSKLLIMEQVHFDYNGSNRRAEFDMIMFSSEGGKTRTKNEFEKICAKVGLKLQRFVEIKDCGEIIMQFAPL